MKKFLEIFLSILTAMGGFVEIGELVFSLNAGAKFAYHLLWVSLLGTVGIILFGEMSGRIACVAKKPVFELIRERAGFVAGLGTLVAANLVSLTTCAAEIGGVALILKLFVGVGAYKLWILAGLIFFLIVVWVLSFQAIERVFGMLGLLMIVFIVAALKLGPNWSAVAKGFIPALPEDSSGGGPMLYFYYAVALLSSIMLPYETYFYASGLIEDGEKEEDVPLNRIITAIGFTLGSLLAVALIVIGAELLKSNRIEPELPGTAALGAATALGRWGLLLGLGGMFFAFGGAAIENALTVAYNSAQFFGWPWGKFRPPRRAARFSLIWIVTFLLAAIVVLVGPDPVSIVEYSIVFSVVILPLTYLPMLLVARDSSIMKQHVNGWAADILGWFYFIVITLAAAAAIPLLILTHGGKGP
jgi:Mn2+/Fe2+ NRAMP family transporter